MSSYYEKILATGEVKCIDEEIPFEIPKGWEWERFGNVMINKDSERVPLSVAQRQHLKKTYDYYGASGVIDKVDKYLFDKDLLLIGEDGANLINRSTPIAFIAKGKYWVNNHAHVLDVCSGMALSYVALFINAISLVDYVTGTAQPKMNQEKMNSILLAIPPVKEQHRILEKMSMVDAFIDKYASLQTKLDSLDNSVYELLGKSILQEAIQGKLVPQITEEGTAQELLEQIKAEKQKLVKEGKLKKSALASSVIFRGDDNKYYEKIGKKIVCIEDEVPFEIPNSWVWARLGAIVDFSKSQTISSSMLDMDSWILDLEDIEKDSGRLLQKKRMKELLSKSDKHLFYKGNVLYSKLRPYLNKVIVADEDGACTTEILAFDFGHIYNKYAQAYLMSPFFVDYANSDSYGIKMPRLGSKKGNNALFPIPPLREQQRIVEKIEQLTQLLK